MSKLVYNPKTGEFEETFNETTRQKNIRHRKKNAGILFLSILIAVLMIMIVYNRDSLKSFFMQVEKAIERTVVDSDDTKILELEEKTGEMIESMRSWKDKGGTYNPEYLKRIENNLDVLQKAKSGRYNELKRRYENL